MNDAEFKAYVATQLVDISFNDLTELEKSIFKKLEAMKVLTLDKHRVIEFTTSDPNQ